MKRNITRTALLVSLLAIMLAFSVGAQAAGEVDLSTYGLEYVGSLYDPATLTTENLAALEIMPNCATASLENGMIKITPAEGAIDSWYMVSTLGLAAGTSYNLSGDALAIRVTNSGDEDFGLMIQFRKIQTDTTAVEATVDWANGYTLINLAGEEVEFEQYYDKIAIPAGFDGYLVINFDGLQGVWNAIWNPLYRDGGLLYKDAALTDAFSSSAKQLSLSNIDKIIMYASAKDGDAIASFGANAELLLGGMYVANIVPGANTVAPGATTAAPGATAAPNNNGNPGTGAPLMIGAAIASIVSAAFVLRKKK